MNMNKTAVTIIIVLLVLAGLGYWIYNSPATPTTTTTSNTDITITPQEPNPTPPETSTSTLPAPTVKEFVIEGKNFSFAPSTISVKKGDQVKITLKNTGGTHDLKIDEFNVGTKRIQSNQADSFTFVADKTGSFQYYCSVGSHRAMGMWGTLVVTQ